MRKSRVALGSLLGFALAIQLVPYGRDHQNPARAQEPEWDHPRTRELVFRVCRDCHSNETQWPWYSFVAPASWLVQRDVEEGRSHFNVSEWDGSQDHGDDAAGMVREAKMPPWFYLPLHAEARLTDTERDELVAGLVATFGEEEEAAEEKEGEEDDDHHRGHEH